MSVAGGRRTSLEQLRRHVERRARQRGARLARIERARPAEVHQHDAPADLAHHVLRLDVAVERPAACSADSARHRSMPMPATSRALIGPRCATACGQRFSLDELHPDADLPVDLLRAVDGDDVGVADAGEMLRFGQRRSIGRHREELERDFALELRIPCPIDGSERAGAGDVEQREMTPDLRMIHAGVVARGSCSVMLRCASTTPASRFRPRTMASTSGLVVMTSARATSPRRVLRRRPAASPISQRSSGLSVNPHLLGEPNQRAAHRHARRPDRRLAEQLGDFRGTRTPAPPSRRSARGRSGAAAAARSRIAATCRGPRPAPAATDRRRSARSDSSPERDAGAPVGRHRAAGCAAPDRCRPRTRARASARTRRAGRSIGPAFPGRCLRCRGVRAPRGQAAARPAPQAREVSRAELVFRAFVTLLRPEDQQQRRVRGQHAPGGAVVQPAGNPGVPWDGVEAIIIASFGWADTLFGFTASKDAPGGQIRLR